MNYHPEPKVQVVTDATTLVEHVQQYWPRRRLSSKAAEALLRKFHGHSIQTIIDTLELQYIEDPDADAPSWKAMEWMMGRPGAVKWTPTGDHADWVRAAWLKLRRRIWPHQTELLGDDRVGEQDLLNWWAAEQAFILFRGYVLRPNTVVPEASAAGAKNMIQDAHFKVRNLRVFGHHSTEWQRDRLAEIESEAGRRDIKVERVVMEEGPF